MLSQFDRRNVFDNDMLLSSKVVTEQDDQDVMKDRKHDQEIEDVA